MERWYSESVIYVQPLGRSPAVSRSCSGSETRDDRKWGPNVKLYKYDRVTSVGSSLQFPLSFTTMSNIARRSKSTPHLTIFPTAAEDSVVESKFSASLKKQKSFIFDHTFTPKYHGSSPVTPALEREDPFSLGGFFPSPLTTGADQQWNWLRAEEGDDSNDDDESEIDPSMPHTPILANADLLIQNEDKMGILTLCELMRGS